MQLSPRELGLYLNDSVMMPSCTARHTEVTHERIDGWWAGAYLGHLADRAIGDTGNDARLPRYCVCFSD